VSLQTRQIMRAMPGTIPELAERTGYTRARVLEYIMAARSSGDRIEAVQRRGELTVFHGPSHFEIGKHLP